LGAIRKRGKQYAIRYYDAAGRRRWETVGPNLHEARQVHRIFVRRALWRAKFVTPKSRRSRRTIDLAPTLRSALARLPSRFQGGLVFCRTGGKPIEPDNFIKRQWARALRRAHLRRIHFHDLRHTYASLLIAQGAHPKYIQAQLGHAAIQTTPCGPVKPSGGRTTTSATAPRRSSRPWS
jgi:integrase